MPAIPEWAIKSAKQIYYNSSFAAKERIGQQQQANGTPLKPGAGQIAVNQLLGKGDLIINSQGKIDIPQPNP